MKMAQNMTARMAALQALLRCEKDGYANLVVRRVLDQSGLSERDKAFAARIVYGTVERRVTLQARLAPFLKRPLEDMPLAVRCILQSGLYQALYMDSVPVHAAVSESVELCRKAKCGSAAGFVNAVLRRAAQTPFQPAFQTEAERLSVCYSVSLPVAKLLLQAYPHRAEAILQSSFSQPQLVVRENWLKTEPGTLGALLQNEQVEAEPLALPGAYRLIGAKDPAALAAFQKGYFWVQGLASQLAVEALQLAPGQRVLDLCAAPGGKTAAIAGHLAGTGEIIACELHENRLGLIRAMAKRLEILNLTVCQNDAAQPNCSLPKADRVLCDVPCSGLGTLAKKPDIRYKQLSQLPKLVQVQKAVLETSAKYVAPGGILVYSTCTINPQENQQVVQAFLKKHPDFVADTPAFEQFGGEAVDKMTLFLPDKACTDGFFIACLKKV